MLKGYQILTCNVCRKDTAHYSRVLDHWKEISKINCYDCSSFVIIREGKMIEWNYQHLGEWKYERLI